MICIRGILAWYIGVCATLVLVIQALSAFHAIALGPLLLGVAAVALLWFIIVRPRPIIRHVRIKLPDQLIQPVTLPFLLLLPVIAAISFALGWHMPPNNWDSMTYHLSRAAYWRQWHTLAHFPTNNVRQDAFPGNAEVLLLVTLLVAHSAKLAFLVQFSAYLAATIAVYGLGRQLGLRPVYAVVGAGAFATMPEVVLQSTSAQNDLVVAAFSVSAVYFLVDAIQQRRNISLLFAGAALGLAIGAKPTAVLALPGIGLGATVLAWRLCRPYRLTRGTFAVVSAALLMAFLLGAPWYIANKTYFGDFSGPSSVAQTQEVAHPSLQTLRINIMRYAVAFIDLEGPFPVSTAAAATVCNDTNVLRAGMAGAAGITAIEPKIEWPGLRYSSYQTCSFNEDVSWFGLAGCLAVAAALACLLVGITRRKLGLAWLLAAGVISSLVCASLLLRWSPWQGRLLITTVALGAPLLSLLSQRLMTYRWGRLTLNVVVLYAAVTGLQAATNNAAKPLSLWNANHLALQTMMRPEMAPVLDHLAQDVPLNKQLDIFLDGDD